MSSLAFIVRKSVKNSLLELRRKPGTLVLYLLVLLAIGASVVGSFFSTAPPGEEQPLFWLELVFFAFIAMFVVFSVFKGLSGGDAIFEMNDVNLLFVSPISSRKILLYGILRLVKVSFLAGFFILFQSSTLGSAFGISYSGVLLLFLLFIVSLVSLSMVSLMVYGLAGGSPGRKRLVKLLLVVLFLPLALVFLNALRTSPGLVSAVEATVASPVFRFFPVAGWASAGAGALLAGRLPAGLGYCGLLVLSIGLLALYIIKSRADYYEDVLVATETVFERKRATEEGNVAAASSRRVKVTKTGISGTGSRAIFGKHLRESFRQNRLGLWSVGSLIAVLGSWAMAFLFRGDADSVLILQILMWMQVFLIGNGRGLRELYSHYIYMIPEPSMWKIVYSNLETVFKTLVESLLIFIGAGLLFGDNVLVILGCILCYTLFSLLLIGVNYLFMRWTGANIGAGLLLLIYFFAVLVAIAPGLVAAMVAGFAVGGAWGLVLGLAILSAWEAAVSLLCFFLSRGVLHSCDMPTIKKG